MENPSRLVLVIDDDTDIVKIMTLMIEREGYRVESSSDGAEAQRKALELKPDLLVLDLMLPRYGGFEILRGLQGTELSKVPVIVMTGRRIDRSTADMLLQESNVVEVMQKPADREHFVRVMNRVLRGPGQSNPV